MDHLWVEERLFGLSETKVTNGTYHDSVLLRYHGSEDFSLLLTVACANNHRMRSPACVTSHLSSYWLWWGSCWEHVVLLVVPVTTARPRHQVTHSKSLSPIAPKKMAG